MSQETAATSRLDLVQLRIRQASADDAVMEAMISLLRLLESARCEFLFVGSCALQTYLPHPHRLPNDIDVVINDASGASWSDTCSKAGVEMVKKPARILVTLDGTLVHVLTGGVGQVDLESGEVFDFLPLDPKLSSVGMKEFWLVGAQRRVHIPVPSMEAIFAMTLLRPLNSNTFLDCQAILQICTLSTLDFVTFCRRTPAVTQIVISRLEQLKNILVVHTPSLRHVVEQLSRSLQQSGENGMWK